MTEASICTKELARKSRKRHEKAGATGNDTVPTACMQSVAEERQPKGLRLACCLAAVVTVMQTQTTEAQAHAEERKMKGLRSGCWLEAVVTLMQI